MRLAMRLPSKRTEDGVANDVDPRETTSAEIIDLASRTSYPAVAQGSSKSDSWGLVAGIAIVAALGAVTLWSMDSARVAQPEPIGHQSSPQHHHYQKSQYASKSVLSNCDQDK